MPKLGQFLRRYEKGIDLPRDFLEHVFATEDWGDPAARTAFAEDILAQHGADSELLGVVLQSTGYRPNSFVLQHLLHLPPGYPSDSELSLFPEVVTRRLADALGRLIEDGLAAGATPTRFIELLAAIPEEARPPGAIVACVERTMPGSADWSSAHELLVRERLRRDVTAAIDLAEDCLRLAGEIRPLLAALRYGPQQVPDREEPAWGHMVNLLIPNAEGSPAAVGQVAVSLAIANDDERACALSQTVDDARIRAEAPRQLAPLAVVDFLAGVHDRAVRRAHLFLDYHEPGPGWGWWTQGEQALCQWVLTCVEPDPAVRAEQCTDAIASMRHSEVGQMRPVFAAMKAQALAESGRPMEARGWWELAGRQARRLSPDRIELHVGWPEFDERLLLRVRPKLLKLDPPWDSEHEVLPSESSECITLPDSM